MSNPTTIQLKGSVVLASDTGTTTQIGNSTGAITLTGTVNAAGLVGYAPTASPTFTGTVTIPAGALITGYAPTANPTLTGTVTLSGTANNTIVNGRSFFGGSTDTFPSALINATTISPTIRDGIAIRSQGQNAMWYMVWINQAGTTIGKVEGDGSTVIYATSSDRRLKKNILPMENILDKIMLLKPCNYDWINTDKASFGFVAQEVLPIFPQMFNEQRNSDGNIEEPCDKDTGEPSYYGLDYGRFTPYIVKAIQELKQDYDTKLAKLEARLLALENPIV